MPATRAPGRMTGYKGVDRLSFDAEMLPGSQRPVRSSAAPVLCSASPSAVPRVLLRIFVATNVALLAICAYTLAPGPEGAPPAGAVIAGAAGQTDGAE